MRMNKKSGAWTGALIALILIMSSCQSSIPVPSPTNTLTPTFNLPTRTAASIKGLVLLPSTTVTQTPPPPPTTISTITITPKPDPDVDIFYLSDGVINRFNLRAWAAEKLELSDSEILEAAISPDQLIILFIDKNGLHIAESPFTKTASSIPIVGEAGSLVISADNHLAYADQEGLKIYNIKSKAITLLKSHFRQTSDMLRISFYIPIKWSPDSKWLWIRNQYYESAPPILLNIMTGVEYDFSTCTSDIDWSPDNQKYVTTVFYSGYYGCGENNGVFVGNITRKNFGEEIVYSEGKEGGVSSHASWDPSGNKIVFVQETNISHSSLYRLLLLNNSTQQIKELDSGSYEITTPKWSEDGNTLYYIIRRDQESWSVSLDLRTSEKMIISNLPKNAEITAVISAQGWLLLRIDNNFPQLDNILLLNAYDGRQTVLANIVENDWIDWGSVIIGTTK
jgi:Tol biopolymer transport system component